MRSQSLPEPSAVHRCPPSNTVSSCPCLTSAPRPVTSATNCIPRDPSSGGRPEDCLNACGRVFPPCGEHLSGRRSRHSGPATRAEARQSSPLGYHVASPPPTARWRLVPLLRTSTGVYPNRRTGLVTQRDQDVDDHASRSFGITALKHAHSRARRASSLTCRPRTVPGWGLPCVRSLAGPAWSLRHPVSAGTGVLHCDGSNPVQSPVGREARRRHPA